MDSLCFSCLSIRPFPKTTNSLFKGALLNCICLVSNGSVIEVYDEGNIWKEQVGHGPFIKHVPEFAGGTE
jgi:hypothetical protein